MIVTITVPASADGITYGKASILADENHQIDIPQYVAKAALDLIGVTGPAVSASVADLVDATEEQFELNYLFLGHGVATPEDIGVPRVDEETGAPVLDEEGTQIVDVTPSGIADKAAALLTAKGAPVASLAL